MARRKIKFDLKQALVTVAAGTAGIIIGNKVVDMVPVGSPQVKTGAVAAAGALIAAQGVKKKSAPMTAFGTGMAGAAGVQLFGTFAGKIGLSGINNDIMITQYTGRNLPNRAFAGGYEYNEMATQ